MNNKQMERHSRHALDKTLFKRARDFYLYTQDGTRFVDLDMASSRAVLGYKASGIGVRIKQNLDKGIFHEVPTMWQSRFAKTISLLFSHHSYAGMYMQSTYEQEMKCALSAHMWHPFANLWSDELAQTSQPLCLAPPLAWDPPLYALLLPHIMKATAERCVSLCVEDTLAHTRMLLVPTATSPVLYAVFCSSLGALLTCASSASLHGCVPSYRTRHFPAEHKNKPNIYAITQGEDQYKGVKARPKTLPLPKGWRQQGVYVVMPPMSEAVYLQMREKLWKWGFFMPQKPRRLMTLPPFFTKRELSSWQSAVVEIG